MDFASLIILIGLLVIGGMVLVFFLSPFIIGLFFAILAIEESIELNKLKRKRR